MVVFFIDIIFHFTVTLFVNGALFLHQTFKMEKLKQRWGIHSNFQVAIIFIVFAINGSLALYITDPITSFLGIYRETTAPIIYWPVRILAIFVVYQITLVIIGSIFGQKKFFWNMEKKILQKLGFHWLLK